MAKVKFPLEMANGTMVRNLDELKENFDIKKVIGYFLDGKLQTWLEDRYYDEEFEALSKLDENDSDLSIKLCSVFGIDSSNVCSVETQTVKEEQEKKEKIKQITDDENIIDEISNIAFNQEDLQNIYSRNASKIYLADGVYNINLNYEGVEYIGIQNNAIAYIDSEKPINFLTKKILFTNVKFDEKYTEKIKTSISQKNKVIIDENKIVYISTKGKIKCITMNKSMTCTENNIGHINKLINSPIIEIHRCVSGRNETYAILDLDGNIYYFNSQSNNIGKIMIDGVYLQICLTSGIWGPVLCAVNDKNEVITCELAKYNSERECIGYCEKKEIPPIYKMSTSRYQDVLGIDTNGRVHIIYTKTVDSHLLKEKRSFLESLPHVQNIAESGNYLAWIEENGTVGFASRNNELGCLEKFNPDESIIDIISVDNTTFAILYSNGSVDYIGSYSEEKDIFKTPLMMILGEVYESTQTQMAYNGIHLFQYENMGVTKDGYLCTSKGICEVTDVAGETQKIRLFE